ncbi:SGNH/GDSL hydrolase family protein [Helicobacter monodelphidis]|uniref:SGNH/GDSL hydrolase family protein n=1 Tax=Helicobacter sp. 15-1451 TaxID=2004995 RepID=UPI0015EB4877|nr:SGNH family hydrolase [Helicobacter sp. 15-1451]
MSIKNFFFIIVSTLILTIILMNQPLKQYLMQQHYDENYPALSFFSLLILPDNSFLKVADGLKKELTFERYTQTKNTPEYLEKNPQKNLPETNSTLANLPPIKIDPTPAILPTLPKPKKLEFALQEKDKVLLIGDSLMQGVGMTLVSTLQKKGAEVINLSKQSTGLTYKTYFNWQKTLQEALNENSDIKYIVALFGANDPWDMIDPNNRSKFIKFKSEEWEKLYRERIQEILNLANTKHIPIFWYEVPYMKKKKLNDGVVYLNQLYADEVKKGGGIFLRSNEVLSDSTSFSPYITDKDKKIKVRTNDGIHFTAVGSRKLSQLFIQKLSIKEEKINEKTK